MASKKATEHVLDKTAVEKSETTDNASRSTTSIKPATSMGAESPRTARDPDFDDEEVPETTLAVPEREATPQKKRVSFQDDHEQASAPPPPPKPPRPVDPNAEAEATLIEAFPAIDLKVVKAVLLASGGKVEPAFNALLSMSDPDSSEPIPPPPPRKSSMTPVSQLEADAIYARQLAQHYDNQQLQTQGGYGARTHGDPPLPRRKETGLKPNELYDDKEHSFIDDDLPVIKQNLQKGFEDTKKTINSWITDFTKKFNGDDDDPIPRPGPSRQQQQSRQDFGQSTHEQLYGIRKTAEARQRSRERRGGGYDADPQLLSDDFGHRLELRDDESPPARPPRPAANPNLFRSNQDTGIAPVGILRQPSPAVASSGAVAGQPMVKTGKWQPLSSIEPKSEIEDRDPFSLGDSDEEVETKKSPEKESSFKTTVDAPAKDSSATTAVLSASETEKSKELKETPETS